MTNDWTRHAAQVGVTVECDRMIKVECRCGNWVSPWRDSYVEARADHVEHVDWDH